MAGEICVFQVSNITLYVIILNEIHQVWNTLSLAFETRLASNWSKYVVHILDSSPSTGIYLGNFPSLPPGNYTYVAYQQLGGTPNIIDSTTNLPLGAEKIGWNGTKEVFFGDIYGPVQLDETQEHELPGGGMITTLEALQGAFLGSSLTDLALPGIVAATIEQTWSAKGSVQVIAEIGLDNLTPPNALSRTKST